MSTLFRVESKDINDLSAIQLTTLLKLLLHLEARRAGIAERAVDVALNITVADGGEDGRIQWVDGPKNTNFLPCRFVQFQNKATDMEPADCAKEIANADGSIKPMIDEVLGNGGAYILFITQELNKKQKLNSRISAIRKKLSEQGKPYATTAIIDIYDASKIEGWVNNYISAIVAVLNWVGRPLERGLKTWYDWGQHDEYRRFPFVTDEHRKSAVRGLRSLLSGQGKCARVIGLSGIGKTRLAFEVFRDISAHDDLSKRVVYVDANANPSIVGLLSDWVQCGLEGIVVVDNCDISTHDKLRKEAQRADSKLSLLTLDYNFDQAGNTEVIQLKRLPDEIIKQMIEPVYKSKIPDLDRVITFAQGFPQMAVLLADARLDHEAEMGSLTDDVLAHKMLWGGRAPIEKDEKILTGCALFDRFGFDEELSSEYEFIADKIVEVSSNDFFACVKRFEQRGLIDRRGRFARLVPKPLAIRLAADWWRRTRPQKQREIIESEMPGTLLDSFCDQISRLDFLPEVKTLTERLCGPQGPFGQAEVILSSRGSLLFRALVEVNPDATSKVLLNVLQLLTEQQLFAIDGDVRRNLVWALEKICFHETCFEAGAKSLLLLASAENESWSNNASGLFQQLFRTFLSGTEAPPMMRLILIDYALNSDKSSIRKLAVQALEKALDTHGGVRTIGAEYQGSGEPLVEWRPKIWQEAFDYWDQALNRLCNLVVVNDTLAPDAKTAIAYHIRGLMIYGRAESLDTIIKKIVKIDGPLWPAALSSIKDSLNYEGDKMPPEGKLKLEHWVSLLTPEDLPGRLKLYITNAPFEHEQREGGHFIDLAAEKAKALAIELSPVMESIIPHLDSLLIGEQRQAYWFATNLVQADCKWEPILTEAIERVIRLEKPNIALLLGILNGIFICDSNRWQNAVDRLARIEGLIQYYASTICSGKATNEQLNTFIKFVAENKVNLNSANNFTYGRSLDHLPENIISRFVKELAMISDDAAWIALDILSMYCHGNQERWDLCRSTFKELILELPIDRNDTQTQMEMHHWRSIIDKLLMTEDEEFAKKISSTIVQSCSDKLDFGDLRFYVKPVLRNIFKRYGRQVWPIFAAAIKNNTQPIRQYRLTQLLSAEDSFDKKVPSVLAELPDDLLRDWCVKEPVIAPEFVASATDVLMNTERGVVLSPRAQFLIDHFGDNDRVLSSLSANMGSFGWTGSLVPYYQSELAAIQILKNHNSSNVREWAQRMITYLEKMIEKEKRSDEEHDWGIR